MAKRTHRRLSPYALLMVASFDPSAGLRTALRMLMARLSECPLNGRITPPTW